MTDPGPEGFIGSIMAFEGVRGSITAMNGPTGCKYYPASLAEAMTRRGGFNPMMHDSRFYLGQSRLPCTYMDSNDYVSGCKARMEELWNDSTARGPSLICLINSPGASLIGEELGFRSDIPVAAIEGPLPSSSFSEGYETANLAILQSLRPMREGCRERTVNLLGISVADTGWEDSVEDLRHLLSLCGIEVICSLGADCATEDIRRSGTAALNVAVHDERCLRTARWYESELGTPFFRSPEGAPIGFGPLRAWIEGICERLATDPSPALKAMKDARSRAKREISRLDQYHGLPRGSSFSLQGRPSLTLPILKTLHGYLGMVPVAVNVTEEGPCKDAVEAYLTEIGCGDACTDVMYCPADIVVADGNTAANVLARGFAFNAVDIDPPGLVSVNIRKDALLGLDGTLRLLDRSLQGLRR